MKQKSGPDKVPAEQVVKDIRRQTRRQYSAEEKIRIVLEGLRGEENISELCRREGIAASMYYGWSKEFPEAGKRRLAGDTVRAATSREVKDLRPNIALCPQTWRIVQKIPGVTTVMFSVFEPGKRLPPHRGPYNGVLRLHLGLLVPEQDGNPGIRIGSERRSWSEGSVLVFDDAYEHEAWNETDKPRVVLFVDFEEPLRFPANIINRVLLKLALLTPYLREGNDNLRRWERQFHSEI
jgi:transposase-like protein